MWPGKFLKGLVLEFLIYQFINNAIVEAADTHFCYHCENEGCEDPVISECKGVREQEKCFIRFDTVGNDVVQLGCLPQFTEDDYVWDYVKNKTLYVCSDVNCNNLAKLPCLNLFTECSSNNEETYSTTPTSITKPQLSNYIPYTQCYQSVNGEVTERGCLFDLKGDDSYMCLSIPDDKFEVCQGKVCKENVSKKLQVAKLDGALCNQRDNPRRNTMTVHDEWFECYKCSSDDCEEISSQPCTYFHKNDQCYVLYNKSSIVAMGCRSEFKIDVFNELLNQKKLLLCNKKNCNAPETLPTPKLCSICNSDHNPSCATNPNLVRNITRCATLPYTQCFTRVNSYGYTERGCLGHLEKDDVYNCLITNNGLCDTCDGDKCNEIDIYPGNRLKCQQCESSDDPKCVSNPNSNKVCELYKEDDQCVSNYRNGVTYRGCKSKTKCDNEQDSRTCRICENDGCNTIDMQKVLANGVPGIWQDTPLKCYTCKGEEECTHKSDFSPCSKNLLQNCMTVFNSTTGKVSQRGCSDSVEKDNYLYCELNPAKCLRCNSNGCNEASSFYQYIECTFCESDVNGNCTSNVGGILTTRLCYKFCMTALYTRFKENNSSYGLFRSCYDDMEHDDRELCTGGKKEHCKTCNTPMCNIIDMPEKRRSCYICEGSECENPKAQKCPSYSIDDKCYTLFDENNQVIALGCRSHFSNLEASYLLQKKQMLLCDDENCNSISNIPDSQSCVLCNSRTDKSCAVNPADSTGQTYCFVQPYTNCYSRVLVDGATERGCLSSLFDDDFLRCLNATSKTCQTCKGNYCNINDFPTCRLRCHICNSSFDPYCEDSPKNLDICSKYDPLDTCATIFRNNVTYRDCSSSLACDDTNPSICRKCSHEGCNIVNLSQKQDENFGMWQDLPLTCLSCSGSECILGTTNKSLTCAMNNNQDCITVFEKSGKVIARGCSDSVESEYCSESDENCYKCKSNNCNTGSSKSDYEECVYCNSNNNQDCIRNPLSMVHKTRKCQGGCMSALYPTYISDNPAYEVIRTCLNDKELSDQHNCSKDKNCSACKTSNCNVNNIPENPLSCFGCAGVTCEEPDLNICHSYREDDYCFTKFDDTNSISEMGCISSFRSQDMESTIKTKKVHFCSGASCNSIDKLPKAEMCAVCSSEDDVYCAVSPADIATFNVCGIMPHRSCYTKLTKYGTTERGCVTDLPADDFAVCVSSNDDSCDVCHESGCNREIFPWYRQQCFSCTSQEESHCESFPTTKKACPIVSETESCITALSGNVTVRGCKSLVYCDANDRATCRSCFGSECNSIDLLNKHDDGYYGVWQQLPLKCHTCVGEHCLHSLGPTIACSSQNIYQDCMTVFDEGGHVEWRGCSDEVESYKDLYCRKHPKRCFKCKSNECNIAWNTAEYVECLFCNSANESLCVHSPEYSSFNTRHCYKNCMIAIKNEKLIRSCLDDREMLVQYQCQQNGSKECSACSGPGCNNFVFPTDRLNCHICTNASCTSSVGQYCELYDTNDFCFAKYENGSVNLMGCASSKNASDIVEWSVRNMLYKCESSHCNEMSKLPKEEVCVSCDSNKSLNCAQNPKEVSTTVACPAPSNKCVTQIDEQGHTIRTCFSNLKSSTHSCEELNTCAVCTGEKCNSEIYPNNRLECHICNSTADSTCKKNPSSLNICPIYVPNDKCVSALDSNGFIKRGCASYLQCIINDSDYCNVCSTSGCNTVELTGSANTHSNSLLLTLIFTFASILVLQL